MILKIVEKFIETAYKLWTQNVYTNTKVAFSLSQTVTMVQNKKTSHVKLTKMSSLFPLGIKTSDINSFSFFYQ